MVRAAAQVAAVFTARAAVQIPIFKTLKVIKEVIISNLAKEVSNRSNRVDNIAIQSS